MKLSCIIIEDEAVASRRLEKLVMKNGLFVDAVLHSVQEAKEWFNQHSDPDLIFLDIQLGDGLSFEIFEQHQPSSAIIFTTAYDEYALRAFKFNSIDYLLKPIQERELKAAIEQFVNTRQTQINLSPMLIQQLIQSNFESKYRERFLIKIGQKLKTVDTEDISLFYSEDSVTYIQTEGHTYLIDNTLDEIEEQVNPNHFFRISRRAIVHLPYINEIVSHSGSRLLLQMKGNNENWIVSRERVQKFKLWLAK